MNIWKQRFAQASRSLAAALVAGGLGLAALAAHASDDPPGRVGRLAEMRGQVWLLEEGQGEWQSASINRPLTTADRIATDQGGRAEVQVGSTTVRLGEASDLEVTRLDDDRIELTLHGGSASLRVREPEVARELQLTTPEGRFQPRGPGLFRIDRSDRGSLAAATQGELDFESSDSQLTLRPGQRADLWVDPNDRRTHYSWSTPVNDEFEQWVRSDTREQQYASRAPISPEMTGAEDLDRNGQWSTHPEYGTVWYPTTVVAGWAPYRYGRWTWVRPWGWTWVDDAPWGFAPFHYGRWVYWGNRWAWAPGVYVRRPVYAPAMVAWVGGSHLSMSVSIGGGQPVGWVPLAPREPYYPAYRVSPVYIQQVNVTHVHLPAQRVVRPNQPVMYANSGVAGGVTVVSSDVLTRRQAVASAARPADADVVRALRNQRGVTPIAPPTPANASFAPRTVAQPGRAVPPPPTRVAGQRAIGNPDDPRGGIAATVRQQQDSAANRGAAEPGRPVQPMVQRPGNGRDGNGRDGNDVRQAPGTTASPVAPVGQADSQRQRVPRPPVSQREPAQVMPQGRQDGDVPGFGTQQHERREQREGAARGAQPAQPMQPVQPAPRVAPRDDRQVERQPERQVERQQERQERKHEPRRDNQRDSHRDGANSLN
jgi:FecR protein